jgi:hypothetical protein
VNLAVAQKAVVDAVVVVAWVVLGGNEMDGALAVEGVFQIRAVAALAAQ